MAFSGVLRGLDHRYGHPIEYFMALGGYQIYLNELLGEHLTFVFDQVIECVACGRIVKKTYNNGYCYPCFRDLPENDLCIVKPSLCHFDQGTCRDSTWGKQHCMRPHYVYLALSSDIKVGLTGKDNELHRWIDQGAVQAFPIAELPTRKLAGDLELHLSQYLTDKTDWRKMLREELSKEDLVKVRAEILTKIPDRFAQYVLPEQEMVELTYPMQQPAVKLKSFDLLKQPTVTGKLIGIKGQYLIFDEGVFNVRKHYGFHLSVVVEGREDAKVISSQG